MRVTIGDHDNKFVRHLSLGDTPVKELWLGDRKLYPSDEERVQRLFVELPEIYSDEWCILQHGLDALKMRSKDSGYMVLRVAGYSYAVSFAHSGMDVVEHAGDGFIFSADEGPSLRDVSESDVCELDIYLPVHSSLIVRANPDESSTILPLLPASRLYGKVEKWKKKTNAVSQFWVSQQDEELFRGQISVKGHKRGVWTSNLTTFNVFKPYPSLRVACEPEHYPHASHGSGWVLYPAISQTIKTTITKITTQ